MLKWVVWGTVKRLVVGRVTKIAIRRLFRPHRRFLDTFCGEANNEDAVGNSVCQRKEAQG
jgi:hypothetical protein